MKLATERTGSPDGRLVVVTRDLSRAVTADGIAPTLQDALERWDEVAPALEALSAALDTGAVPGVALSQLTLDAPLPRSWQWLDGSAFATHAELMTAAYDLDPVPLHEPLMYQGMSHRFLSGDDDVPLPSEADGIDFEGEYGVITDAVPMGTAAADALGHVRLVVQINDWSLRVVGQREMKTGFGWIQGKPASSMAPVAVTPDELGPAWANGRIAARLDIDLNGHRFGAVRGDEMMHGFQGLIAHAARTRDLCAGTIVGSGTLSSAQWREVGSCCIAERRAIETLESGAPQTDFMRFGDIVRMEARRDDGQPLFGAIHQRVVAASRATGT